MSLNVTIIQGNLTRDPELKYTPSGSPCADISVAVNEKWKDKDGQLKEEVSYFPVVVWGKQAESVAQYLKKGSSVLVQGRLKQDRWEDKETQAKRNAIKVIADRVVFLGGKGSAEVPAEGSEAPSKPKDEENPF